MLSERRAYTDNASRCVEPTQPCKTLLLKHRPAVLNPLLPETANSTQLFFCSLLSSGSSAVPVIKPAGDLVLISSKSQGLFSTEDLQGHLFSIPIPAGTPPPHPRPRAIQSHDHCDTFHHSHQVTPFPTLLHFAGGFARGHTGSRI